MGVAGTDAAIETADVALMTDDLATIADTIRPGREIPSRRRHSTGKIGM